MNVEMMTIDSVVRRGALTFPSKTAIVDRDQVLTYGDLDALVDALAVALLELGVRKGHRVGSLFFNEWQSFVTYFAVVRLGAVVVPINHRLVATEMAYQLAQAGCRVLLYTADLHPTVEQLRGTVAVEHWIAAGSSDPSAGDLRLEDLLARYRGQACELPWSVGRDDPAGIWYTSGTTGYPKGTVTTHESAIWAALGITLCVPMSERHRLLCVAPTFHRSAMDAVHLAGFLHGTTHFLLRHFDPSAMLGMIQEHRLTHGFIVPAMTFAVLSHPERGNYDLTSMEVWLSASAALPEEHRARLEAETTLPPGTIFNAYGITESLINTSLWPYDAAARPGSVGRPVPGVFLRVVDADRRVLPAGVVGEIAVAAPSIASTYLDKPEAWAEVTFEENGRRWYLSGDLGRLDDDGYLYIVDRAKDMIITGGENVYSAEVERVLIAHPDVLEVAVVGIPDEQWGERVTAAVVLAQGSTTTREDIVEFCGDRLAGYKRPRRIHFMDALPRNTFGKVQKHRVRELLVSPTQQPAEQPVST
jgi:acyl-CoA synthetase (AMP-forming)/AMP-acid ligase II